MIVTVKPGADPDGVRRGLVARGLWVTPLMGDKGAVHFLVRPYSGAVTREEIARLDGVADVAEPRTPHPLVDAQPHAVRIGGVTVGGGAAPVIMAGPCSVESEDQILTIARRLRPLGVTFLRGGAFKPRTSPYDFQGCGAVALRWLASAAHATGLLAVSEALGESSVADVAEHADVIQVGSRNMHNSALLRAVGAAGRPTLLKRGMAATLEEWLLAGEYLLAHGAPAVIFCERGIRSFDPATRNLLDLSAVAILSHVHHQPVIVDPSHALGRRDLILPMSRAALAAGAAGLLLETHTAPEQAMSDGPQTLTPEELEALLRGLPAPGAALGAR